MKQGPTSKPKEDSLEETVEELSGPNKDVRAFLFENLALPTSVWQLFGPPVLLIRAFCIGVFLVTLSSAPLAQHILAIIVEIAYLVFIIKTDINLMRADYYSNLVGQIMILAYISGKILTVPDLFAEQTCQSSIGSVLGWILLAYGATGVTFALYGLVASIYRSLKGSCSSKKEVPAVSTLVEPHWDISLGKAEQSLGITSLPVSVKNQPKTNVVKPEKIPSKRPLKKLTTNDSTSVVKEASSRLTAEISQDSKASGQTEKISDIAGKLLQGSQFTSSKGPRVLRPTARNRVRRVDL